MFLKEELEKEFLFMKGTEENGTDSFDMKNVVNISKHLSWNFCFGTFKLL